MYKINYKNEVKGDLAKLDKTIRKQVFNKIEKIAENPEVGDNLSGNLAGCKKVYVANKKIRIVYKVNEKEIEVLVVAIGKRENKKVYSDALKRI